MSLDVEVDLATEHNFYSARTRDVSMGGLFIRATVGLEPGTPVTVKLALGKKTHELATKVAWVLGGADGKPVGFGVEFDGLSANAARAIEAFVKKRDPMQFGEVEADDDGDESTAEDAPLAAKPPPLPPKS